MACGACLNCLHTYLHAVAPVTHTFPFEYIYIYIVCMYRFMPWRWPWHHTFSGQLRVRRYMKRATNLSGIHSIYIYFEAKLMKYAWNNTCLVYIYIFFSCLYVYMYVFLYICMYIYICIYIYIEHVCCFSFWAPHMGWSTTKPPPFNVRGHNLDLQGVDVEEVTCLAPPKWHPTGISKKHPRKNLAIQFL